MSEKFELISIEKDHYKAGVYLFRIHHWTLPDAPDVFIGMRIARSMFEGGNLLIKDKALLKGAKDVFYRCGGKSCVK